jgi:hypothetical protein
MAALAFAEPRYRTSVVFRLTITSAGPAALAFWEPGAPPLEERLAALPLPHERGFVRDLAGKVHWKTGVMRLLLKDVASREFCSRGASERIIGFGGQRPPKFVGVAGEVAIGPRLRRGPRTAGVTLCLSDVADDLHDLHDLRDLRD